MNARTRLIVAGVLALVVVLLAYFLLIGPRKGELSDVREQVEAEENRTVALRAELDSLQALQRNAPQLQAELDRIRDLVPREHEVANFIFQVNDAAAASGVELTQLTPELPKQPPEGAQLAQVRITIGGDGGYFAIQDFVRRLYSLDRALRIDVFDLVAAEGAAGTGITMTATARIFFENPLGVTGIPPATPVAPTPAPAAPAPASPAAPDAGASPTAGTTP